MRAWMRWGMVAAVGLALGAPGRGGAAAPASPAAPPPVPESSPVLQSSVVRVLDQGWSPDVRRLFYTTSQGSTLMPYAWFAALERVDSTQLFLADDLARYGYLPNDPGPGNPHGLPVGFAIDSAGKQPFIGMTCAACHTGQLSFKGQSVRLDGAPTHADFQSFLVDLSAALLQTANDPAKFARFATRVGGDKAKLRADLGAFATSFAGFNAASLQGQNWGPARLDAFSMIFNRLTGLDFHVPANVHRAVAPVSYPFLWNAHQQNAVQWNLSAPNGDYLKALARNTGEVLGVFGGLDVCVNGVNAAGKTCADLGTLIVSKIFPKVPFYNSTITIAGLMKLEWAITQLTPPTWPVGILGAIDKTRAERGRQLFNAVCADCHHMTRDNLSQKVWVVKDAVPVPIDTDPTMYTNAQRSADTGPLNGTLTVALDNGVKFETMPPVAPAVTVLSDAVLGSVVSGLLHPRGGRPNQDDVNNLGLADKNLGALALRPDGATAQALRQSIGQVFSVTRSEGAVAAPADRTSCLAPGTAPADAPVYEARPLFGIWATAPYLHNGSVPNLWALLKSSDRPATFSVGSLEFDPVTVGYVSAPGTGTWTFDTSQPGNCNKGHDGYTKPGGVPLTDPDLWDLLEFMKILTTPDQLWNPV